MSRVVVGWNEYVDLPEYGVRGLRAKLDTGARSSALHVDGIEEIGGDRVRFQVVLQRSRRALRIEVRAPVHRRARVRSSDGHAETRIFVENSLILGPVERRIEISLVDRRNLVFRLLLGRTALKGFLVDAARANLLRRVGRGA